MSNITTSHEYKSLTFPKNPGAVWTIELVAHLELRKEIENLLKREEK
ncbi:MAG: hypothetical protein IE909_12985 [Campylobacterales bacterium]|nr:hypothetical protein [Campylobacterales bacterium]